jgi:hypothetical protein
MFALQQIASESQAVWQQSFFESLELSSSSKANLVESAKLEETAHSVQESTSSLKDKNVNEGQTLAPCSISSFPIQKLDVSLFQKDLKAYHRQKVIDVALKIFKEDLEEFHDLQGVCLVYTGSDGREEKLSPFSSPLEMIFIAKKADDLQMEIVKKVQSVLLKYRPFFDPDIEVKCLETDSLICFNRNWDWTKPKDERPFPTRALDAQYLIGDRSVLESYKTTFYRQVRDSQSRSSIEFFNHNTVRATMQVFRRCLKGSDKSQMNLEEGIVNYDGAKVKGPKYPFLRAIQYKLGEQILKYIQTGKLIEDDFLKMPFSTIERIQWLADKRLLNIKPQQMEEVQKAYIASLIWFGQTQKNFELEGIRQTFLSLDEVKFVAQAIDKFCHDKKIFH